MVDIDSGSDTRVLVKKVMEWEKANRVALPEETQPSDNSQPA